MKNHNKKEKAYLEPMQVWPYKRTCDWKYKKMMRMADTKGDGLYAAAMEGLYRTPPYDLLAAFLDNVAAVQSKDGMLRLIQANEKAFPWFGPQISVWLQPTYAAAVLGIYTQLAHPGSMNKARQKTLAGLLRASMRYNLAGYSNKHGANYPKTLEMFIRADTKRFVEKYPSLCPEFTAFWNGEIERLRREFDRCDCGEAVMQSKNYTPEEMSAQVRKLLALYDGCPRPLFVYGTLMRGQAAHDLLKGGIYGGRYLLFDHAMYDLGRYPAVVHEAEESVLGELWFVTDEMMQRLDDYEGSLYKRVSVTLEAWNDNAEAETYLWTDADVPGTRVPMTAQPWHSADKDSYVWYAAYGTNLLESRMACYLQGGLCAQNGKMYDGCTDRSLWTDTGLYYCRGHVYFGRSSGTWEGKGVPFFKPVFTEIWHDHRTVCMKLYRITRGQLDEVQEQEGNSDNWYGKMYCLGLDKDGTPIITLTSRSENEENAPCDALLETMYLGLTTCCEYNKTEAVRYLRTALPKTERRRFDEISRRDAFPTPPRKRKKA